MQDQSGNSALSMGGGAVRSNNFLIDGFPTTDIQNRSSINPSMEALQDARVQIHTYDAEMGRTGGGVMNMAARGRRQPLRRIGVHGLPPEKPAGPAAHSAASTTRHSARSTGATAAAASAGRSSRTRRSSGSPARRTWTSSRRRARSRCRRWRRARGDFSGLTAQRPAVLPQGSALAARLQFDDRRRRLLSGQRHSRRPAEFHRADDRELHAGARPRRRRRHAELQPHRRAAERRLPVDAEGQPQLQQRRRHERLLPAAGHRGEQRELQPGPQVRRQPVPARSARTTPSC